MSLIKFIFQLQLTIIYFDEWETCFWNSRLIHLKDDGKLEIFIRRKKSCGKKNLFIECTELNWYWKDVYGFCVSIFSEYMGDYLLVIEKLHNNECLIYIFIGEVISVTPINHIIIVGIKN